MTLGFPSDFLPLRQLTANSFMRCDSKWDFIFALILHHEGGLSQLGTKLRLTLLNVFLPINHMDRKWLPFIKFHSSLVSCLLLIPFGVRRNSLCLNELLLSAD